MTAPGSKDDREIKLVDVSNETVLTVLVFPNGKADVRSSMPPEQVRETLLRLAEVYRGRESVNDGEALDDHVCGPECAPGPGGSVIPLAFIELTRSEVDGMVDDLQHKVKEPMTTEQLALMLANPHDLPARRHVQALSVMAALLLQRAAYQ